MWHSSSSPRLSHRSAKTKTQIQWWSTEKTGGEGWPGLIVSPGSPSTAQSNPKSKAPSQEHTANMPGGASLKNYKENENYPARTI